MKNAFLIAGTGSGDGKTTIALALMRALKNRKLDVAPFKCGPDYIDPAFHRKAAGCESRNLDCWMMGADNVKRAFIQASQAGDLSVVEGVMGLFDASRPDTLHGSSAEVAELLDLPVVLVVNAKGMAGSIAAMVKGYCEFRKNLKFAGVIANFVGSERHADILAEALRVNELPPLLGYMLRNDEFKLPERHLGLVPFFENCKSDEWFDALAKFAETNIDIDLLLERSSVGFEDTVEIAGGTYSISPLKRVAVAMDEAFNFYYQDNLDWLREQGYELIYFSPLKDYDLPENTDLLYIGGGFPEMFAEELEKNCEMRTAIKDYADNGGQVYAECGGFMYLSDSLATAEGTTHKMCGVIPGNSVMGKRMRSLGYRYVENIHDSPLFPRGAQLRGHEFHWSDMQFSSDVPQAFNVKSVRDGVPWSSTGYFSENITASYIHLYFRSLISEPLNLGFLEQHGRNQ